MNPLHPVALGLVVVALVVDGGGWDLLPDPLGWVLVLLGTRALPMTVRRRAPMLVAAALALLVAAVVWPPGASEAIVETDESLAWALSLPQLAYLLLLSDGLRYAASQAGRPGRAVWFAAAEILAAGSAVLPVLVFGAGLDSLSATAALVASATLLLLLALTLTSAREPWAGGRRRPLPGLSSPGPQGPTSGPDRYSPTKPGEDS